MKKVKSANHLSRQFRIRCKTILDNLKINGCAICGYNKCNRALNFHHANPEDKDFALGELVRKQNKQIANELNKCILLCCNCHMEIEERQQ